MTVTLMDSKSVRTQIQGAARSAKTQREKIQNILIQCAGHAFAHGDVTLFGDLVTLGKGVNQKAIRDWAATFGLCRLNNNGEARLDKKARNVALEPDRFGGTQNVSAFLEHLASVPTWFELKPAGKDSAFDLVARVQSVAKQLNKAVGECAPMADFDQRMAFAACADLAKAIEAALIACPDMTARIEAQREAEAAKAAAGEAEATRVLMALAQATKAA